jgi:hypothetical protein
MQIEVQKIWIKKLFATTLLYIPESNYHTVNAHKGDAINPCTFVICASKNNSSSPSCSDRFILWQDLAYNSNGRHHKLTWRIGGRIATKVEDTAVVPSVSSLCTDNWKLVLCLTFSERSVHSITEGRVVCKYGTLSLPVRVVVASRCMKCKAVYRKVLIYKPYSVLSIIIVTTTKHIKISNSSRDHTIYNNI